MPKKIIKKYNNIKNNICGINEYLQLYNINIKFNNTDYIDFLNYIADTMFNNS